ncbi:MAG: TOBE domain-containing protein, partial [Pseudomonadales bacterium]
HGSLIDVVNDMTFSGESGHEVSVLINAVVEKVDQEWGLVHANIAGATLLLRDDLLQRNQRFRLRLYARDISISLSAHSDSSILNLVPAIVCSLSPDRNPASVLVRLKLSNGEQTGIAATKGESEIIAQLTRKSVANLNLKEGQKVWVQVKSVAILR